MERYDSSKDTLEHIGHVRNLLAKVCDNLTKRGLNHDKSKLVDPEKSIFDQVTLQLKELTYGSEEYNQCLAEIKPGLKHHYKVNSHHPEHYKNGIAGMSMLDILEMLVDWDCATKRMESGDILKSLEINQTRFGYNDEMKQIFLNTLVELGCIPNKSGKV